MSEEELDDLSMPEEIGETDSQDEMYEHFSVTVDKGQGMLRIDKFLTNRMEGVSRNRIQAAADAGNILVGGTPVKSSYKVKPLDRISIVMPYPLRELEIVPENIPLDIRYEDDDLIIVNKPAGMVVHPGHGNYTGTLVNALTYHLKDLPLFQSGDMRAGLVHRIDKNTSGILVIAKNERAHARLAKQFFDHSIDRVYHALVWGNMESDEGTVTGNIGRSLRDRMKMAVFPDGESGKHAVTHYRVLERLGYVNLVECRLETGRTHQIRVHMEYIGHPLFNDERYGGDRILKGTTFSKYRQFVENCFRLMPRHGLHARSLGFVHPTTGENVHFESEMPDDMRSVVERWRNYVAGRESTGEEPRRPHRSPVSDPPRRPVPRSGPTQITARTRLPRDFPERRNRPAARTSRQAGLSYGSADSPSVRLFPGRTDCTRFPNRRFGNSYFYPSDYSGLPLFILFCLIPLWHKSAQAIYVLSFGLYGHRFLFRLSPPLFPRRVPVKAFRKRHTERIPEKRAHRDNPADGMEPADAHSMQTRHPEIQRRSRRAHSYYETGTSDIRRPTDFPLQPAYRHHGRETPDKENPGCRDG